MARSRRQLQRPQWVTRRGARWLLGTSPVLLVLLIFAIKALSMIGVNSAGITAYDEARFSASRSSFAQLRVGNLFQPWIADYNRGTAEYGLRDYPAARESFTTALERVPADYECRVVLNLVATIERQGDELATQQQPREAVQHYEDALRLLADSECGDPTSTPSPSPEPSPTPSSDEPTPDPSQTPQPTDEPTAAPSGEPSSDPSEDPTSNPEGEPGTDDEPQSDEQRREEEAQRKHEQEERIGEKADEQRKNSERRDRDPSQSSEPEPSQEPDSDPSGEQQRREQLEQRNQEGQQEQSRRRDRDERPDQRSDTPW